MHMVVPIDAGTSAPPGTRRQTAGTPFTVEGLETDMSNDELHTGRRVGEGRGAAERSSGCGYDTPSARALRVTMARAFPVRIAPMSEALMLGSITKLAPR